MPPRFLALLIVAGWTAMTGWLIWRDIAPRWRDEPPPFKIDFSDEVLVRRPPVHWTVWHNGQQTFTMKSEMKYDAESDQFEMSSELSPRTDSQNRKDVPLFEKIGMTSLYVVSRDGELRRFSTTVKRLPIVGDITLKGEYRGDELHSQIESLATGKRDLQPVRVTAKGNALNPLQPMDRIPNVRPGQRWRVTLSSPLVDALSSVVELGDAEKKNVKTLEAEVLLEEQSLPFGSRDESCRVIEYSGDDAHGKTWVRASDGLVLRQEFTHRDDAWALERVP